MVTGWHRPTWIEIDRAAIRENIKNEQNKLPESVDLWAVVKANAYGHGIIEVARTAKEAGAKGFCVAILDEALALREAGFQDDFILVLGATRKEDANLAAKNHISLTVFREDWLENLTLEATLRIHLKVDSGMGVSVFVRLKKHGELKQPVLMITNYNWKVFTRILQQPTS